MPSFAYSYDLQIVVNRPPRLLTRHQGFPFSSLIGKLMYCANMTRPDISAAVSFHSRFMSSPTERHWEMAKRVLRYVSGTKDYCLTFTGTISTNLLNC